MVLHTTVTKPTGEKVETTSETLAAKDPEKTVEVASAPASIQAQAQVADAPKAEAPKTILPDWRVGAGASFSTDGKLDIPVEVDRRILGPIMVGARLAVPINGGPVRAGVVVSVEF